MAHRRSDGSYGLLTMAITNQGNKPQREVDHQLDQLETAIARLRILYEQYFTGILPRQPEQEHKDVKNMIKLLLKAPFKNSQRRFRLRTLVNRFQTYGTYWERVLKQKEEGTYFRDVFKAELRERQQKELEELASKVGASNKGMEQLYSTYENAIRKNGGDPTKMNFDCFKKSMLKTAQDLKKKHGVKKVQYKVVIKNGKVVLKASAKNQ